MEHLKLPDYVVLDCETSIKNRGEHATGNMKASPFHPDNKILYLGWKSENVVDVVHAGCWPTVMGLPYADVYVGSNIKFDMLYLLKQSTIEDKYKDIMLWDIMIVEYLITGQQSKFASLDKMAEKYGGTIKDSTIKQYWEDDIDTELIPKEEILPYLDQDVLNTELVFKKQWEKVKELDMLPLVESQMAALKATIIMEHNGMYFDIQTAVDNAEEVRNELDRITDKLLITMEKQGIRQPNPGSNEHISLLIFGGTQTYIDKVDIVDEDGNVVLYKSGFKQGQVRQKNVKKEVLIPRMISPLPEWKQSKGDLYKVNDEVLSSIKTPLIEDILMYRKLSKDLNTYYIGFGKLFWTHDDCIHGTINHCATATGRMSSSSPNMQNLSSVDT